MKLRNNVALRALLGLVLCLTLGSVQAVTILTDPTHTESIPGLTNFSTTGAMMDGMVVTATFESGFSESLVWADTGPDSGGVSGNGWSLTVTGDTFGANWEFSNNRGVVAPDGLVSLTLDGHTGLTVFDLTSPSPGSPGSESGWSFTESPTVAGTATYSHIVAIGASAPVGDLWQQVDVVFDQAVIGDFTFIQDTDNDSRFGIPVPGSLALLGLGLAGVGFSRRRKA